MTDTIKHADCFAMPRSRLFLLDVCARFARRGALRVFQLRHEDSVVASRIGFVLADSLYLYYSGYKPGYGKYSVMTRVVAESMKYAIAQGLLTLNLSTGLDVSKTRWAPAATRYREVEFPRQSRLDILRPRSYRAILKSLRGRPASSWLSRTFRRDAG